MQHRDSDIDAFFKHENHPFPPSLSDGGKLRFGKKSDLLQNLTQNDQKDPLNIFDATALDGAAIVHLFPTANSTTFDDDSIEESTREKRGKGFRRKVAGKNKIPGKWKDFLRDSSNKEELTVDTDVLVILIGRFHHLLTLNKDADVWISFGTGKNLTYYSVNAICCAIGRERSIALPLFHSFTGCDITSCFHGRGKRMAWQAWNSYPEVTQAFSYMAMNSYANATKDDVYFKLLERFVVVLYDKTSSLDSVDEDRKELFCQKCRSMENIPPTQDALFQHVKRAAYQGGIWTTGEMIKQHRPLPDGWGWTKDPDSQSWRPVWTILPIASKACSELVKCFNTQTKSTSFPIVLKMVEISSHRDRLYSWIVSVATMVNAIIIFGTIKSGGVFFISIIQTFNTSRAEAAIITTTTFGTFFGFGAGLGFCFVPNTSIICHYFDKHKGKAFGMNYAGGPLGSFIFPPMMQVLINTYGLKGALLILSAIVSNMVAFSAIIRDPPNLKKANLSGKNIKTIDKEQYDCKNCKKKNFIVNPLQSSNRPRRTSVGNEYKDMLVTTYLKPNTINSSNETKYGGVVLKNEMHFNEKIELADEKSKSAVKCYSNMPLKESMALLFKDYRYYYLVLIMFACNFSFTAFNVTIPDFAIRNGSSTYLAVLLISLASAFDLVSRLVTGTFLDQKWIKLSNGYAIVLALCSLCMFDHCIFGG
ncbi:Monocarboxylate transporter 12 [Nymphon striatum]|nr:Monocarboxylate transporter 12 [Nymphon striatum]